MTLKMANNYLLNRDGLCVLCLREVQQIPNTQMQKITTLCEFVQHQKFKTSTAYQKIIEQHDVDQGLTCQECLVLINETEDIYHKILQLQELLRSKVVLIRIRILDSDEQKLKLQNKNDSTDELEKVLRIQKSLLRLSDEDDGFSNVQIKVKAETTEEDQFIMNGSCSPSAFLLHPDKVNNKEDVEDDRDSEYYYEFVTPQEKRESARLATRRRQRRLNESDNQGTTPKKRGRRKLNNLSSITKHSSRKKQVTKKYPIKLASEQAEASISTSEEIDTEPKNEESKEMRLVDADLEYNNDLKLNETKSARRRRHLSKNLLNSHVNKFHKFDCKICDMRFATKSAKSTHDKDEHKIVASFQCTMCKRKFFRIGSLQSHMVVKHETDEKNHVCDKCDKRFTLEVNLERHLKLHKFETEKTLVCEVCDSRFADHSRLERHMATHNKAFLCTYCNQSYSSNSVLSRHQRRHTGEKPYQCDHCEEKFIDKAAQQWHTAKIHSTQDQHHLCPVCGKSFFSAYILKAHLDRHAGKQNISCKKCGEKFYDSSSLKTHCIQKHDDEPLICDECGAKFMTGKGLKQHKMSHAGLKPYQCDVCDARFLSKWVLTNHMRSHTGERPYQCPHCDKAFKAKKHVDTHVKRIHSEDYVIKTPFRCLYCHKAYPRKGILDGHIRQVHTGERPFQCEHCNKGFALNTTLRLHLKSHGINVSVRTPRLPRSKREQFSSSVTQNERHSS
ncbi:oocyte zinc finger protein XlCOF6 [Folsomia candida]|nr:oocyte zinc finger protein XlCOF6 [Folsomia candida]